MAILAAANAKLPSRDQLSHTLNYVYTNNYTHNYIHNTTTNIHNIHKCEFTNANRIRFVLVTLLILTLAEGETRYSDPAGSFSASFVLVVSNQTMAR